MKRILIIENYVRSDEYSDPPVISDKLSSIIKYDIDNLKCLKVHSKKKHYIEKEGKSKRVYLLDISFVFNNDDNRIWFEVTNEEYKKILSLISSDMTE